jgi:hypothetical protein
VLRTPILGVGFDAAVQEDEVEGGKLIVVFGPPDHGDLASAELRQRLLNAEVEVQREHRGDGTLAKQRRRQHRALVGLGHLELLSRQALDQILLAGGLLDDSFCECGKILGMLAIAVGEDVILEQ